MVAIEPGDKFGCLAFRLISLAHALPVPVDLGYGCWALPGPPLPLTEQWRAWLGEIESEQIGQANLVLFAKMKARAPANLDDENQLILARTEFMYWGTAITAGVPSHENIVLFSGANDGSEPRVRSIGQPRRMYVGVGMMPGQPTLADLAEGCDIMTQIEHIRESTKLGNYFRRISSGIHALITGFRADRAEDRLHQCVRAIEAFLPAHAWGGGAFVNHTLDLVRPMPDADQVLRDLYRLRNITEHHGDLARGLPDVPEAQRSEVADRRVRQAEGLARFVYRRLLKVRTGYVDLTRDDASIARFWSQRAWVRRATWGEGFDLNAVTWNRCPCELPTQEDVRESMRAFGWMCVGLGLLIVAGTVLWVRENNRVYSELCARGRPWACASQDSPAGGLVVAALVAGFGVLLLAIRKPADAQPTESHAAVTVTSVVSPAPATLEELTKKCPECAETIKFEAVVCRYCRYRFDPAEVARQVEQQWPVRAAEPQKPPIRRWRCPRCSKIVEGPTCACGWGY